jgi:hypothetical protein
MVENIREIDMMRSGRRGAGGGERSKKFNDEWQTQTLRMASDHRSEPDYTTFRENPSRAKISRDGYTGIGRRTRLSAWLSVFGMTKSKVAGISI